MAFRRGAAAVVHSEGQVMTTRATRILIVDDCKDSAAMADMVLRQAGYETKVAYDGAEAIVAAKEFMPDAVLLDLALPRMSGTEVADLIRADPKLRHSVLIAVTGYVMESSAVPPRFDEYIEKPVDDRLLLRLLSQIRPRAGKEPGLLMRASGAPSAALSVTKPSIAG